MEPAPRIADEEFDRLEPELRVHLLKAQHRLADTHSSLLILVSGVEGAGRGEVVNRLHKWMDARGIETYAFWEETDEQRRRPWFWRFWRALPARGRVGIMFGSWYSQPLLRRLRGETDDAGFERELGLIAEFEDMLAADGVVLVKLWFHLPKAAVKRRLHGDGDIADLKLKKSPLFPRFLAQYDDFIALGERAMALTGEAAPWYRVAASDRNYRDYTAGRLILEAMEKGLDGNEEEKEPASTPRPRRRGDALERLDLSARVGKDHYRAELERLQARLYGLCWKAHYRGVSTIAVFEGWDAAGKGGAIRRVTGGLDARLYKVISTGEPSDEELAHHYLWRFWRHVPLSGHVTLYDRSWYGRVLVERVEGLASEAAWRRAYGEIRHFEERLLEAGIVLVKFWLHISAEEQLERFEKRRRTPWKRYKLSDDDWRNRKRREDYRKAVEDMVALTGTEHAPWTLVAAEQKKHARLEVLRTLCGAIEERLKASSQG